MRSFMRFLMYVVLTGSIAFLLHDSYQQYGSYKELKAEESEELNKYNELLLAQNESKPLYKSNLDVAVEIMKMPGCHLQNCYVHLKDDPNPVSVEKVSEIGEYTEVESIEYVLIMDSDDGSAVFEDLQIPVIDAVVTGNLAVLNVPSLEK